MADAWGGAFGSAWGVSWGSSVVASTAQEVGHGKPWRQKWRQEMVELLAQQPKRKALPVRVAKAVERALADSPLPELPDHSEAVKALQGELGTFRQSDYLDAIRRETRAYLEQMEREEEEMMVLLLH